MSDDTIKLLRGAIAAGPTPGPWMHLVGDRLIYTKLGDGCKGEAVARVDWISGPSYLATLSFIAAASPDNIAALLDRLDKLAGEHAMMKSLLLSEQAEKREISAECERLRAALDIARDYVATNVAYLRERYRGREQFGRVHEAEGDLAAIDAARAAERGKE